MKFGAKNNSILLFAIFCSFLIGCNKKDSATTIPKDVVVKKMLDAYTEVQYGNMPLIISVPHGGAVDPSAIADRTCPNIVTGTDGRTIELTNAIDSVCKQDYNIQPYLVICHLKRTKIDQNREINEATCGNSSIVSIWNNYHLSIDTCISKILVKYP
jgi:hypothetical protein